MTEIRYFDDIEKSVVAWGRDRDLYSQSTAKAQMIKLIEEAGELAADLARGRCPADSIGDMMVVLTHIAHFHGLCLEQCFAAAYKEIEPRKGRFVDGVFVKEGDDA